MGILYMSVYPKSTSGKNFMFSKNCVFPNNVYFITDNYYMTFQTLNNYFIIVDYKQK